MFFCRRYETTNQEKLLINNSTQQPSIVTTNKYNEQNYGKNQTVAKVKTIKTTMDIQTRGAKIGKIIKLCFYHQERKNKKNPKK